MQEWVLILLIGLIVFSTFTIEGIAGFGSTVMALPFMIMLIGLEKAVPLLSSLNLLLAIYLISRSWRNISFREYIYIVIHAAPGVIAGLLMMDHLPRKILIGLLTFFTLFVGIRGLCKTIKNKEAAISRTKPDKGLFSRVILFCGGIFQGAFGSGGPLVVMYAAKAIPEKTVFRATLPLLWFTTNSFMNVKWFLSGNVWDKQLFFRFLWALPFIAAGMIFGDYLHWKVNQKLFTLLLYTLLIIVAIILGINSLIR